MMGTKRRSVVLNSDADDSMANFQSKKSIAQSTFTGNSAVSPQFEATVTATPSLDRRRFARQHVRALNTEFASWVQSQLQDHPDELWEDGVRDYLTHASGIMGKFTDVIDWLKENSGKEGNVFGARSTEKNNQPDFNSKEPKSFPTFMFAKPGTNADQTTLASTGSSTILSPVQGTTSTSTSPWSFVLSASSQALSQCSSSSLATSGSFGISSNSQFPSAVKTVSFSASLSSGALLNNQTTQPTTTASFAASATSGLFSNSQPPSFGTTSSFTAPWSAGAFSNSQTSFNFGNQSSAPSNENAKADADDENEPEQPSSPSLKRSEEKGIVVVHETKCKLYIKSIDPDDKETWKDKGTGQLSIKCEEGAGKGSKESKPRILVRNDVGRIMLNASLYPGIKTNLQKNAIVTIFHVSDDSGENAKAVARTFLIRTKNADERDKLSEAIRDHAPAA